MSIHSIKPIPGIGSECSGKLRCLSDLYHSLGRDSQMRMTVMNMNTLLLNIIQVRVYILYDIFDLIIIQCCTHAPSKTLNTRSMPNTARLSDSLQSTLNHRSSKAYRARRFSIEQEKLCNAMRMNTCCRVDPTICFEGTARAQ